jgi:hypothetical protein
MPSKDFIPSPERDPMERPVFDFTAVLHRLGIHVLKPFCPVDDAHPLYFFPMAPVRRQSYCVVCREFRPFRKLYIHEPR